MPLRAKTKPRKLPDRFPLDLACAIWLRLHAIRSREPQWIISETDPLDADDEALYQALTKQLTIAAAFHLLTKP